MRFYLETATAWEAQQGDLLGFLHGLVLGRSGVAKRGQDYGLLVDECQPLSYRMIALGADALDAPGLIGEARLAAAGCGGRAALVMPITLQSVRAIDGCADAGVRTVLQYVASPVQALVANQAGADAILLHAVHLGAAGIPVAPLVEDIRRLFGDGNRKTEIWVESVRDVAEVGRIALAGADVAISSWDVLQTLAYHPLTDQGIERLLIERE
ncbi:MAG: hypothetical protein OWU32_08190 [Firmicutes bacterium]|nr:hypothetical protein [Bacillota bacterium]